MKESQWRDFPNVALIGPNGGEVVGYLHVKLNYRTHSQLGRYVRPPRPESAWFKAPVGRSVARSVAPACARSSLTPCAHPPRVTGRRCKYPVELAWGGRTTTRGEAP